MPRSGPTGFTAVSARSCREPVLDMCALEAQACRTWTCIGNALVNGTNHWQRLQTVTSHTRALGATAAALVVVTACASGAHAGSASSITDGPTPSGRSRPAGHLTPSVPSVFTSGTNACGNPYAFSATSVKKTVPLLNCPGQAGLQPLPALTVKTGQQILISGIEPSYGVSVSPLGLLRRHGNTYTAIGTGNVLFVIHHYPFCNAPAGPNACRLLNVTITQS